MALDLFPRFWDAIKSQEQERASSATRLTEATDLKDVLGDEKEVTLFSEYCRSHFCEEQVLFWLEARDYKLLFDPSDMLSQGEMIFDVYVKASAELRVNISDMAANWRLSKGLNAPTAYILSGYNSKTSFKLSMPICFLM